MEREEMVLRVVGTEAYLLSNLVKEELARQVTAIDDIIVRAYDVVPAKHTQEAISEVKVAILVLVRSPLAALEAKLACVELELEEELELEVKPEEEAAPAEEPEPGAKPAKSKK